MTVDYIKEPHTAIFTGQTGCWKTHLVLELIEKEYNKHFGCIVIICLTLKENFTYHVKEWIKTDDNIWMVDPKDSLYQWVQKLSQLLRFFEVLFIFDNIISNKDLDKRRQPLLELSISGRHRVTTNGYRRSPIRIYQKNWASQQGYFVWYPKARIDLEMKHDENDVLTDNE